MSTPSTCLSAISMAWTDPSSGRTGAHIGSMIVSFRSPEVAIPIYKSLSHALGEDHKFIIASPLRWEGRALGRAVAEEALEIYQRRRLLVGQPPLQGLRKSFYVGSMAAKYAGLRAALSSVRPRAAYVWNGERGRGRVLARAARDLGISTLIFEKAPIPGRLTIDAAGVNARASVPQESQFFREWARTQGSVDWRQEGRSLVARKPRKATRAAPVSIPNNYVFLPLQVATDTQILLNGRWVKSIREMLLAAIRQMPRLPEGWGLVVKEHPSCRIKNAEILRENAQPGLIVSEAEDTFALVRGARAVLTLNSSVGLQSFFFDKPVCVLGDAFYRQDGLVEMADNEEELGAQFARAARWSFDPALRDAFMSWLCEEYYVPIDERTPTAISQRAAEMVSRLLDNRSVGGA